jgi:hypothetical protein
MAYKEISKKEGIFKRKENELLNKVPDLHSQLGIIRLMIHGLYKPKPENPNHSNYNNDALIKAFIIYLDRNKTTSFDEILGIIQSNPNNHSKIKSSFGDEYYSIIKENEEKHNIPLFVNGETNGCMIIFLLLSGVLFGLNFLLF